MREKILKNKQWIELNDDDGLFRSFSCLFYKSSYKTFNLSGFLVLGSLSYKI